MDRLNFYRCPSSPFEEPLHLLLDWKTDGVELFLGPLNTKYFSIYLMHSRQKIYLNQSNYFYGATIVKIPEYRGIWHQPVAYHIQDELKPGQAAKVTVQKQNTTHMNCVKLSSAFNPLYEIYILWFNIYQHLQCHSSALDKQQLLLNKTCLNKFNQISCVTLSILIM